MRIARGVRSAGVIRLRDATTTAEAGFTLIEVMIAASVMVVGLMGFLQVLVMGLGSSSANREADLATDAARRVIETMQSEEFEDLFARYNADPNDDPGVAGTAPGANFAVNGLDPVPSDPDGFVGQIILPSLWANGVETLREDIQSPALGMPRDLNGDLGIDQADHATDYGVLPVLVRVQWRGATGVSRMEFNTVIAPY
jgi:prepilin-type N-terminal cleavage/methylation domain-containing protein